MLGTGSLGTGLTIATSEYSSVTELFGAITNWQESTKEQPR